MSNAIQFLESLGQRPAYAPANGDEYASEVAAIEADAAQKQALLDRDRLSLSKQLGGRVEMMMQIWAPDESPQDDEPAPVEQPDDEPDDHGDHQDDR